MTDEFFPIREITPYNQNWTIKARVVTRSEVRTYANNGRGSGGAGSGDNGPGRVFSADLLDREGGEIRASFFGNSADTFDKVLQAGGVYTFRKGRAKVANRQYNQCKHDYELTFFDDATIVPCADDASIAKDLQASYVDLKVVKSKALPATMDILGIVAKKYDATEIITGPQSKNPGQKLMKSAIELCDDTEQRINISFFGESAKQVDSLIEGSLVGLRSVNITNFNTRSGTMSRDGKVVTDEESLRDIVSAARITSLQGWWNEFRVRNAGGDALTGLTALTVSERQGGPAVKKASISDLIQRVEPALEIKETEQEVKRGEFSEVYGRLQRVITQRKDEYSKLFYTACKMPVVREYQKQGAKCQKKIDEGGRCPDHGNVPEDMRERRWIVRCYMQDHTESLIMNAFDAEFTALNGGVSADNSDLPYTSDEKMAEWAKFTPYQGLFKLRVKSALDEIPHNVPGVEPGTWRPRHTVTNAVPVRGADLASHGHALLSSIAAMGKVVATSTEN